MTWKKVSFDNSSKTASFNKAAINDMLERMQETYNLFCNMKRECIKFEDCLFGIIERLSLEGKFTGIHVDMYNRYLCSFINKLELFQCTKVQCDSGLGCKLIGDYTPNNKTNVVRMNYKWIKHGWMNCKDICIIDNMKIGDCEPCPDCPKNVVINIGCHEVIFKNVTKCMFKDTDEFRKFVCEDVPYSIHVMIAHFIKNIDIIAKCIEDVHYLTDHYELTTPLEKSMESDLI